MDVPMDYWWEQKDPHEMIFNILRYLQRHQASVHQTNVRSLRLYGNYNVLGITASSYTQNQNFMNPTDRVTMNIIKSMCDTVKNKIAKNKPKPMFLTSGGDWKMQKKAKKLGKFMDGQFYEQDIYTKGQRVFHDASIFGTGALKIYRENDCIKSERVFIDEIIVDLNESLYGEPRSMYQTKYIPREVVMRMFPEFQMKIKMAKQADEFRPPMQGLANNLMVVEAWHLASEKGESDGRHIISIENCTLLDEEYDKDYFPFVFMRWNEEPIGFYGRGIASNQMGTQVEINKILRTVQISFHLLGVPWVMIQKGSKVNKAHINNEIAHGVEFDGVEPKVYTPQPVNPQILEHLERLYQKAYQNEGISELAAQSQKPAGLDSGKALREFNDIESERFMTIGQQYEKFYLDASLRIIDIAKEIYNDDKSFSVLAKHKSFVEEIKWSDVHMEEDEYIMQVFPISSLSNTPSGRLKDIQEFIQAGLIPQEFATKLMDFPDLEEFLSLANASLEDLERVIEQILDEGKYSPPEPYQNLQTGIKLMQSAYLKGKNDNVPEENLELLRRWMTEADYVLKQGAMAQQNAMQSAQGGTPQGASAPPPQSQLMQQGQ